MIATLYETKLYDAQTEKAALLESDAADTPEIAAADARIAEYRDKALAEYRLALEAIGEDPSIVSKIEELAGQPAEAETTDESEDTPAEEAVD